MTTVEIVGWAVTAIAVTGVVLNNRRHRACFVLWLASNALSAAVHLHAGMIALTVRDAAFFALAIHGLVCWSRAEKPDPQISQITQRQRTHM